MSNEKLVQSIIDYRDNLINEYNKCQLSIDERLPYLDMIIRLNQEIRALQEFYL